MPATDLPRHGNSTLPRGADHPYMPLTAHPEFCYPPRDDSVRSAVSRQRYAHRRFNRSGTAFNPHTPVTAHKPMLRVWKAIDGPRTHGSSPPKASRHGPLANLLEKTDYNEIRPHNSIAQKHPVKQANVNDSYPHSEVNVPHKTERVSSSGWGQAPRPISPGRKADEC